MCLDYLPIGLKFFKKIIWWWWRRSIAFLVANIITLSLRNRWVHWGLELILLEHSVLLFLNLIIVDFDKVVIPLHHTNEGIKVFVSRIERLSENEHSIVAYMVDNFDCKQFVEILTRFWLVWYWTALPIEQLFCQQIIFMSKH